MIKVTPRAQVDPGVLDWYQQAAERRLRALFREIQALPEHLRDSRVSSSRVLLSSLVNVARGERAAGKGLDLVLARLRSLDYDVIKIQGNYLTAYTQDLMIEEIGPERWVRDAGWPYDHGNRRRRGHYEQSKPGLWDAGTYAICVPLEDFERGNMEGIHFIPQRAPRTIDRHMHHLAIKGEGGPLKWKTYTCWGEFANVISGSLHDLDLVESLRHLRIFVGRYNSGSPLISPRYKNVGGWGNPYHGNDMCKFVHFVPNEGYDEYGERIE